MLLGTVAPVIRVFLLRRLPRLATSARLITGDDPGRRVPKEANDPVACLPRGFSELADSIPGASLDELNSSLQEAMVMGLVSGGPGAYLQSWKGCLLIQSHCLEGV